MIWKRSGRESGGAERWWRISSAEKAQEEYLRVLARFALSERALRGWALWLTHPSKVTKVNPARLFARSRDRTDNRFLDAAMAGQAKFIIFGCGEEGTRCVNEGSTR